MAGTADRRGPHVDWGLRFLRVAKAVNRLSTLGKLGESSRLKRDLRVEAFWKVVETISGFIREAQASCVPKNESPLGVSGTATESTFSALGLQPASGDTPILSITVQASCRQTPDNLRRYYRVTADKVPTPKNPSYLYAIGRAAIARYGGSIARNKKSR